VSCCCCLPVVVERTHADFELSRWARLISITCSAVDNHAGLQAEYARTGLLAEDMLDIAVVAGTVAVEGQDTMNLVGTAPQVAYTEGTVAAASIAVSAVEIARIPGIEPGWYRAAHTGLLAPQWPMVQLALFYARV